MPEYDLTPNQEVAVSDWIRARNNNGYYVELVKSDLRNNREGDILIDEYRFSPRGSLTFITNLTNRTQLNRIVCSWNVDLMLKEFDVFGSDLENQKPGLSK